MAAQTAELYAAVTQYIEDEKTWDGLAKRTAFMNHLMGKGKKHQVGGLYIQFPIKLIANTASGFISGTNALTSVNPSVQLQYGTLNWKYFYFHVNFSLSDYNTCKGDDEKVDFFATKTEGALNDAIREWSTYFHYTSTSNALLPEGLLDVVAASQTAYAGLTDTDYSDTTAYLPLIDSSTATVNYTNINLGYTQLQSRMQKELMPEGVMGIMNAGTFARFQSSVQNQQIFTESSVLKAGSPGFKVNGVDFVLDAYCPGTQNGSTADNYVYIFPTDIMKMYYNFGFGTKSPFDGVTKMPNQPIESIQHYISFNLVCNNRRLVKCWKALVA